MVFYRRHELCFLRFGSTLEGIVIMSTLQQRVAEVLNDSSPVYVVDASEANAVDSIFDTLQKAEADLNAAQTRVENLKWQLAKAREYQA